MDILSFFEKKNIHTHTLFLPKDTPIDLIYIERVMGDRDIVRLPPYVPQLWTEPETQVWVLSGN